MRAYRLVGVLEDMVKSVCGPRGRSHGSGGYTEAEEFGRRRREPRLLRLKESAPAPSRCTRASARVLATQRRWTVLGNVRVRLGWSHVRSGLANAVVWPVRHTCPGLRS